MSRRILVVALALAAGPVAAAESLEQGLLVQAREVIRACKAKGYDSVGVLKFHASKDGKTVSDNVGTLNLSLARRLEIALVLQNDKANPVKIIRDASRVASTIPGANHMNPADDRGRAALFGAKYPLLWGSDKVAPAAFVTGLAFVRDDLKSMSVQLLMFDPTAPPAKVGGRLTADVQAGQLGEMGESFALRGAFDDDPPTPPAPDQPAAAAVRVKTGAAAHPLQGNGSPVQLEFRYDGQKVPLEFRDGKGFVPTPRLGQKVELVLTRDGNPKDTYGVVLKVNGENSLSRQTGPDLECRKWVMPPGCKPYTIRGYQVDDKTAEEFKVLSALESAKQAVNYGADVGTVTLSVFRNQTGKPPAPPLDDTAAREQAVKSQVVPKKDTYDQVLSELTGEFGTKGAFGDGGGLVVPGGRIESGTRLAKFTPDPIPLATVTVVYYTP